MEPYHLELLTSQFGKRLIKGALLNRFTTAQVGGPALALLEVGSSAALAETATWLWAHDVPFFILGGGSNLLVSDRGVAAVAVLNRARRYKFDDRPDNPSVWAESGVNFGGLARKAAVLGLSGLEWAAGIPGSLGGAVVGNAGAHGGDIAGNLVLADILHPPVDRLAGSPERQDWPVGRMEYQYRSSAIKRQPGSAIVLAARLRLQHSSPQAVQARMDELVAYRRRTQPPGASMGSMFKNPPGNYAGRLIEAAGLKGLQVGKAQISPLHANFFINLGGATASDIYRLIQIAHQAVIEKFGIVMELEIELKGEWEKAV